MDNIEDVIVSSIEDTEIDPIPATDPEPLEASLDPIETSADPTPATAPDAPVEAGKAPADDFEKKYGVTAQSASGRENRIPYTRVKKISEKAVTDAKALWSKDLSTSHVPVTKYQEAEAKVKDYEARLGQVAEFEKVMTTDHTRFLTMLAGIPGYRELFQQIADSGRTAEPAAQPVQAQAPVPVVDDMPQPDMDAGDGTKIYSMEGLKTLQAWNRAQSRQEVMKEVEARVKQLEETYQPLKKDYDSYQRVQAVIPKVNQQIAEARTWPQFNESEADIVKVLQQNPNWTLERAYQTVILPKMQAERDRITSESKVSRESIRAEILKELKSAPRATSAASGPTKAAPAPAASSGPRSLEDVISDSLAALR